MSVWKEIRCDAIPEAADCLSKSNTCSRAKPK
jgi:hypothetical protein